MRKSYSGNLKAKMAIDMIREQETVAELSAKYEVHRSMLTKYKKEAIEGLPELLSKTKTNKNDQQNLIEKLYMKIGQLEVENDWLKKKVEAISC